MSESNKEVVRRWYEVGVNQGHLELLDELFHPDLVFQSPSLGSGRGLEDGRRYIAPVRAAFPDCRMEVRDLVAAGDQVFATWTFTAHHQGAFLGVPPTGKAVSFDGITVLRLAGGRVCEFCDVADLLGLMAQLGAGSQAVEANKAIVRRYMEEIWNQGRLDPVDECFSADCVFHGPNVPEWGGSDARKQYVLALRRSFPDTHYDIDDLVAEGDRVAMRWSWTGTHREEWNGIAPTGKRLSTTGMSIFQFACGRIVEEIVQFDAPGFLQALGAAGVVHAAAAPR
jgi:steroid delta-isomerase-like uncharacterized protein